MGYQAVRTERWKYIRYLELDGMDELYDLKADPYETRNLVSQRNAKKTLKAMKKELERLLRETSARGPAARRSATTRPSISDGFQLKSRQQAHFDAWPKS